MQKLFANLSIRNKIIVATLIIFVVVIAIAFSVAIPRQIAAIKENLIKQNSIALGVMEPNLALAVDYQDDKFAESTLANFDSYPEIENILIFNAKDSLFVQYGKNKLSQEECYKLLKESIETHFTAKHLVMSQKLNKLNKEKTVGTLVGKAVLRCSTASVNKSITQMFAFLAVLVVIMLVVVTVLAYYLQRLIAGPIVRLSELTNQISEKNDYTIRIEKMGDDETGDLYDNFNGMMGQINERDIAINSLNEEIHTTLENVEKEKLKADALLLNILPDEIAAELKEKGGAKPRYYGMASVLFTDFKGFTNVAENLSPHQIIEELNICFMAFDDIMEKYNIEKIKTIGDAYMCAGGLPTPNHTNPIDCVLAGLEIKRMMEKFKEERIANGDPYWELRLGIHTGPLVAGVVGKTKFAYDIWGDTVNTASRMESSGEVGKVNISGETYKFVRYYFECEHRGKIAAKNKGEVDMYFVNRLKPKFSADVEGNVPNESFYKAVYGEEGISYDN